VRAVVAKRDAATSRIAQGMEQSAVRLAQPSEYCGMNVAQCSMPSNCAFSRELTKFYYWDSFEARLSRTELNMPEIYLGILAHLPWWVSWLLVVRTKIVSMFGIKGPTRAQLNNIKIKAKYAVGEKMALFTLYSQDENEIVAGGDDKHLEFRVSVLRVNNGDASKVVLTTVVNPHNFFGKAYLFFIVPFHKFGVKALMSNAVAEGRI